MFTLIVSSTISFLLGLLVNYFYIELNSYFPLVHKQRHKLTFKKLCKNNRYWNYQDGNLYVCKQNPNYKIKLKDKKMTPPANFIKFPDKSNNSLFDVEVYFDELKILHCTYMFLDGGRIFIPVPHTFMNNEKDFYYYYNTNDIDYCLISLIGRVGSYDINTLCTKLNIKVNDIEFKNTPAY